MVTLPITSGNDCDGDGVTDATEIANSTNPSDACDYNVTDVTLPITSGNDCDGDGATDEAEVARGTDPSDPCSYHVSDITLPITSVVICVNGAPSQGNETMTIDEDDALTTSTDLTVNNIDPEGTTTSISTILSSTGGGTTAINGNAIDYTPALNFTGIDTVIYTVCDQGLPLPAACVNDTLFITVNPVNDAPSQGNETMTIDEDDALTTSTDLTANNIDPDGTTTSISTILSSTGGGTTAINGNAIDYTPALNFTGVDTVIYTVCDQGLPLPAACVNDTLFITVNPVNDAPSQGNETMTIDEDDALTTSTDLTANNIDPDGTTTSISTILSSTGGGTTAINGNAIDYTPALNFTGVDTVIYTVCDQGLPLPMECVNDTLFITVNPVNDAPSQGNETMVVTEDDPSTTSTDLLDNNTDPDGTMLTVTGTPTSTGGGTVVNNNDGTVDYTPALNFTGVDTVIYTVCDQGLPLPAACVNDTLFITVNPVNDAPSQGNETMTIDEDDALTTSTDLTANNIDPDGTTTSISTILSSTGGGTTAINGNAIDYTPALNFTGVDTVIYTVCDQGLPLPMECVNDTLFITVNPVNDAPSQGNETMVVTEDDPSTTSTDLLGNNTDPDGTTLTITGTPTTTGGGTVVNNNDGTVDYTPALNFTGIDTVIYTVCDQGLPLPAACVNDTLFITVNPVNDAPSQGNETMTIDEDDALTTSTDLTANNIDPDGTITSISTILSSTGGGTTAINGNAIDYTPALNFTGVDTVIYTVCDQGLPLPMECVNDTLFITVNPVNDAPSQGNETMVVTEDDPSTTSTDLLGNNTDPDGTTLTITGTPTSTGGGTVVNNNDGTVDYTPALNFTGIDTVIYTVCDQGLPLPAACVNDTLFITVNPVNDAPSQGNETMTIDEDDALTTSTDLTANNIDPDGTITSISTILSSTGGGTTAINGNAIDYTPALNFTGVDTVIYTVCDQGLPLPMECVNDTLFITVNPVNDAPSQGNETMVVTEDDPSTTSTDLLDNNTDPDGTMLTVTGTPTSTGGGTVVNNNDGTVDYTPALNFTGIDTVIYTVCDQGLPLPAACVNDTLFITVNPVNDAPSQGNETMTIDEDDALTTSTDLTANNIDPDGTTTSISTILSSTGGGTTAINGNAIDYTPALNFTGVDTVIYTVCDQGLPLPMECVNDTLFITVNPVNDAPSQGNEIMTGIQVNETNATTSIDLTLNNVDVEGTATDLTAIVSSTAGGTITMNGNGTIDYIPALGFIGTDTIIYTVCDNGLPMPVECVNDTLFVIVTDCLPTDLLADCDGDGVTNGDELTPPGGGTPTDPTDPCSYNVADQTIGNVNSTWNALDCDGDGVTNEDELTDGTDPNEPCDYLASSQTVTTSASWNALDCDGDGTDNGTDDEPLDPCVDQTIGSEDTSNPIWQAADCDGDGVPNGIEETDGTDSNDPCDYLTSSQTVTTSATWNALDCDGDGVTNEDELTDGTDPNEPCDYLASSQTVTTSASWNALDCDGDGTDNGTDDEPLDPCVDQTIGSEDTSNPIWQAADCDGDGVPNGTEETDGTDSNDPCDYLTSSQTLTTSATWNALDCDGDGVTNEDELTDGTDPNEPCDYLASSQTVTTSASWNALDCDGDGTDNGTDDEPLDPCVDQTIGSEDTNNPIWQAADCDGDGVPNGTEETDGTDSNDPCDYLTSSQTLTTSATWNALDCDGDGVTNEDELTDGTDPNEPCDYLASSQTVTTSASWNALDCDGDGTDNGTDDEPLDPCVDQTIGSEDTNNPIWQAADCDGDGVPNGTEETDGTDSNDPCDYLESSQTLEVTNFCGLIIPEGFSPNNDGVNDKFVIEGLDAYENVGLVIFNRWGNKVFSSNNYNNDWDGTNSFGLTFGERDLPTGTYFYLLDLGDGSDVKKGYIYLNK